MKNVIRILGIIAIVAVIGFSFTACDNGDDGGNGPGDNSGGGGTLTITDIPATYNGMYAMFQVTGSPQIFGFQSFNTATNTFTLATISNGRVIIPAWTRDSNGNYVRYSGSDTFTYLVVNRSATATPTSGMLPRREFSSVTFSNGSATKSWNDATGGDDW